MKLEQNTLGQASRQASGLEGLKPMEIKAKQYDKEGPFFGLQNVRKNRHEKWTSRRLMFPDGPVSCQAVTGHPLFQNLPILPKKEVKLHAYENDIELVCDSCGQE